MVIELVTISKLYHLTLSALQKTFDVFLLVNYLNIVFRIRPVDHRFSTRDPRTANVFCETRVIFVAVYHLA